MQKLKRCNSFLLAIAMIFATAYTFSTARADESFTTSFGPATAGQNSKGHGVLLLNGLQIYDSEDDYVEIQGYYKFPGREVLLISHQCGGASCGSRLFYRYVELSAGNPPMFSKEFQLGSLAEAAPTVDGQRLVWKIGYKRGQLQRIIYENRRISIVTDLPLEGERRGPTVKMCDEMYEMLKSCIENGGPSEATDRSLDYLGEIPGIDISQFYRRCNGTKPANPSTRSDFFHNVCKAKIE